MSPLETVIAESAGGVLYRRLDQRVEVALILVGAQQRWQLPKGTPDKGETVEQAALREVREETGLQGRLVGPLERIEYWFASRQSGKPVRFHKFVHFFLMEYQSGDVADHDHEVEEARWFEIGDAIAALAFESEKKLVRQASEQLQK